LKKYHLLCLSLAVVLVLSGCSMFRRSMASEEDRKAELYSMMPKVLRSYRWSAFEELAPMFSGGISIDSVQSLHRFYKNKKVKEAEVEQIDFDNDVARAYQLLQVKTFSPPRYLIESHLDQITWEFSASGGGWKIIRIDIGNSYSPEEIEAQ
jgi:uncharacterized protein YceK